MGGKFVRVRHRPCPICGESEVAWLKRVEVVQPSSSPLPGHYDLVACQGCDFVFADTAASQTDYDHYYASQAKYAAVQASGSGESATDRLRLAQTAERLLPWLSDQQAPWLDLGCGRGGLLEAMAERGCTNGQGLDPDQACARSGAVRGLTIRSGTLAQAAQLFAGQRFELIVLSHVLEHVLDLSLLRTVSGLLAEGGHIYIEVPDASRYGQFLRPPFYYLDSEHINHFGAFALTCLLRPLGLTMQVVTTLELPLADGVAYPALALVAHLGSEAGAATPPGVVTAMKDYLDRSQHRSAITLAPALPQHTEVLLWGAGSMAQRLLGMGLMDDYRILGFLDNDLNKQGRELAGCRILSPDEGLAMYPGVPVVICVAIDPLAVEHECLRRDVAPGRTVHGLT